VSQPGLTDVHICCDRDPFTDLLPTGALGLLLAFTQQTGFFDFFVEHFQLASKTLDYSPLQKLQTLICSVAVGCDWTKDINHKLRPYVAAAQWLGMERFPDQSSINRFLHQLGSQQRQQLELISEQLLQRFGLWQQSERVDLDIDSTGLMVYGRTFEGIRKGYFPRQRGRRGYRLSLASTRHPAGSEILALFLDPANVSPAARFWDCIYQTAEVLGSLERIGVILADAACGSGTEIAHLLELNLSFIIKGFAPKTARRFAAQVAPTDWESIDLFTRVCDIGPQRISQCSTPVRTILVELMTQRLDRRYYSHLYTALSPQQADASQIFHGYNQRQSIEALVKTAKYGLSLTHLRTRSYQPIQNFLQVVALTFNLLSWFRHYLLAPLQLQDLGIYEITQKLMDIPAKCTYRDDQMILSFPANHPFTPALAGS
jgi:hypothetical protein